MYSLRLKQNRYSFMLTCFEFFALYFVLIFCLLLILPGFNAKLNYSAYIHIHPRTTLTYTHSHTKVEGRQSSMRALLLLLFSLKIKAKIKRHRVNIAAFYRFCLPLIRLPPSSPLLICSIIYLLRLSCTHKGTFTIVALLNRLQAGNCLDVRFRSRDCNLFEGIKKNQQKSYAYGCGRYVYALQHQCRKHPHSYTHTL